MTDEQERAIAAVESLRAGIPTRVSTQQLPDLRSSLTRLVKTDLEEFQRTIPAGRLLWGAYGQGKTHALTTIEHAALDMGFVVSRVSLSREVSCHQLFNFYGRAASSMRVPDSRVSGIQRLLDSRSAQQLPDSPIQHWDRYEHPLPAIVLEDYYHTTGEEQDKLYGDLLGTRLAMPELKRIHRACRGDALPKFETFRTAQHAGAYFGVLADAVVWCGYRGWVILIDEVELVGRLSLNGRLQAYRNLQWLLNWSDQMPYSIYTVGVAALRLRDDVWSGGEGPHARSDRLQIPDLAAQKFCPDVGEQMKAFFQKAVSAHCPTIEPVSEIELARLLARLLQLHSDAYGWQAELDVGTLIREIGNRPIRTHIRAVLESLDHAYVYHCRFSPEVTNLVEPSVAEEEEFFNVETD